MPKLSYLLASVLSFQIAVLPGCSSAPLAERSPAQAETIDDQETSAMLASAFDSLKGSGWRTFDAVSGAEILGRSSLDNLQPDGSKSANVVLAKEGLPLIVQIATMKRAKDKAGMKMVVATYKTEKSPDFVHMTASELNLAAARNLLTERLDLSAFATAEDLRIGLDGLSQRVTESLENSNGSAGRHVGLKIAFASAFIILATVAVLGLGIMATYGKWVPTPQGLVVAAVVAGILIFAANYGIVKNAEAKNRNAVKKRVH